MKPDHQWLEQSITLFENKNVLELGCGNGIDTKLIAGTATSLVACDLLIPESQDSGVEYLALDHSKALPFDTNQFDVVLASLSLHYFHWSNTLEILNEISRVLIKGGTLICRLNSKQDVNFGAIGHPELEPGLYDVNGTAKRFFDREDIVNLFSEKWQLYDLQHTNIDRYHAPKSVWEFKAVNV